MVDRKNWHVVQKRSCHLRQKNKRAGKSVSTQGSTEKNRIKVDHEVFIFDSIYGSKTEIKLDEILERPLEPPKRNLGVAVS